MCKALGEMVGQVQGIKTAPRGEPVAKRGCGSCRARDRRNQGIGYVSHRQELGIGTIQTARGKPPQGSKQESDVLRSPLVERSLWCPSQEMQVERENQEKGAGWCS